LKKFLEEVTGISRFGRKKKKDIFNQKHWRGLKSYMNIFLAIMNMQVLQQLQEFSYETKFSTDCSRRALRWFRSEKFLRMFSVFFILQTKGFKPVSFHT
jgi:hypothetical protein